VGRLRNLEYIIVATAERPGVALRELAKRYSETVETNPVARLHPEPVRAIAG
jgi:hypothetical protein